MVFSDFLRFDTSLLLLTVTLRGVSNKHCLLPFFIEVAIDQNTCMAQDSANKVRLSVLNSVRLA